MGNIGRICILGLLATLAAFGQTFTPGTAQGSITATSASCTTTACVQIAVNAETSAVTFAITGTFSATITFEATLDGTNWFAYSAIAPGANSATTRVYNTTAAATGIWQMNAAGFSAVRARCSAYTSGTAGIYARRSTGPAAP
jgi:hypothetical protein